MYFDLYEIQDHTGLEYCLQNRVIISDAVFFSCETFCAFESELVNISIICTVLERSICPILVIFPVYTLHLPLLGFLVL